MNQEVSYTTEEIAQILRVSKLTVYDLIKKGELPAYRVGRQMRVDAADLEAYKLRSKGGTKPTAPQPNWSEPTAVRHPNVSDQEKRSSHALTNQAVIISGQDISLDLLANKIEKLGNGIRPLRSYNGSLNSLLAMYKGESDVVSTHLLDADTNEYNIPYIRKILVGQSYLVVNLMSRWAGLYVQKNNPKQLSKWEDLGQSGMRLVNREKGSGARVLLDEQLRIHKISKYGIFGYHQEETSHLGVASVIAAGHADVGVGIEKAAQIVGVDFIPMIKESYDLVILKSQENQRLIEGILEILQSTAFQQEIQAIGGYDVSRTGTIVYETE
ncbi:substrate-binding domain-containing protein [Brevibacillus ginsengisoli]|uniref:substrate-binding domain-containing protein n=1 Tax=Brevibacillus ginsengisoli TaxID=363854 RepID=UPI003CF29EBF